jgi:hypothetical protein
LKALLGRLKVCLKHIRWVPCALATLLFCGCVGIPGPMPSIKYANLVARSPTIMLTSPALMAGNVIPARYVCGRGVWLPLRWSQVPVKTVELILFIGALGAPRAATGGGVWTPIVGGKLIVGILPSLHRLDPGGVPRGAVELMRPRIPACPSRIGGSRFVFRLFAFARGALVDRNDVPADLSLRFMNRLIDSAFAIGTITATSAPT